MTNNMYFIHIRKTAGTSMRAFLESNFSKDEICPEKSQHELYVKYKNGSERKEYLNKFKLISGHYYTVNNFFENPRFTFTMLRDPISRTISEINQIIGDKNDLLHRFAIGTEIKDWFSNEHFKRALNNAQTRQLVENSGYDFELLSDSEALDIAEEYLLSIDFYGLTEFFEISMKMLSDILGIERGQNTYEINREITRLGYKAHKVPPFISEIYSNNSIDIELYQRARKHFDRKVSLLIKK